MSKTTIENVTDRQINKLAAEAAQAGDEEMYRLAVAANNGDGDARAECVAAINAAEAQSEPVYRCASPHCPGYPYRASDMAHPVRTCGPREDEAQSAYRVHRAAIEADGLSLSTEPVATVATLREALEAAADHRNHGPEGAAIARPDGRVIYTREEYDAAHEETEAQSEPAEEEYSA